MILAISQYGEHIELEGKHPRKELLEKLYAKHAEKIYVDTKSGETKHTGYIVGSEWYTFYNLTEWAGGVAV